MGHGVPDEVRHLHHCVAHQLQVAALHLVSAQQQAAISAVVILPSQYYSHPDEAHCC